MPKGRTCKYYAVLNGRGGPNIYSSREEYQTATHNFSAASAKSFLTYSDAREWLESAGVIQYPQQLEGALMSNKNLDNRQPSRGVAHHDRATSPSLNLSQYPASSKFWVDRRPCVNDHVNVGVQCPDIALQDTFHEVSKATVGHSASEWQSTAQEPNSYLRDSQTIQLSSEQKEVLALVRSGRNVFFTGPAGTGKSVLLREIIKEFKMTDSRANSVAVTAPTGIAGLNIGGSTIHSFAGIGLGKEPAEVLANKIKYSKRLFQRWVSTVVLIIDEISMLDAILFDKLEYIARFVRDCPRPFGGIQLVICGDFFQLPPVPDQSHNYRMPATFAFDAQSWSLCISKPIFLTRVFRQKDNTFIDILASMRTGVLTSTHIAQLQQLSRPLHYADGIEPTELYPLKREAESCNNRRLKALTSHERTYCSVDGAGYDVQNHAIPTDIANQLLDRMIAVSRITIKIGAQVMLIQNMQQGVLVNGSLGKVMEFLTTREALDRHIAIAMPASLKNERPHQASQSEYLDLKPSFGLRPINSNTFSNKERWPMVRFTNGSELLCSPVAFSVEGFKGNIEAHRFQVPLILAWALSIHKSQGQTLARVKVDLGQIFEKGQAYVALSRATNLENLEIQNFQPSKVMAHPRVIKWQEYWTYKTQNNLHTRDTSTDGEMDSEEAVSQFWASLSY